MLVTKESITTHIFEEAVQKISRGDDTKITEAITSATATVSRYMGKYDFASIQELEGEALNPYAELITIIKDIAKWHFIAVANVQVDYEIAEKRYTDALKALIDIRDGQVVPGWQLAPDDNSRPSVLRTGSRPKFKHYFN